MKNKNSKINLDEIKALSFEGKIDWLNDFLDQDDTSDDYDGLMVKLIFTNDEIDRLHTMKHRRKSLVKLLGNKI